MMMKSKYLVLLFFGYSFINNNNGCIVSSTVTQNQHFTFLEVSLSF